MRFAKIISFLFHPLLMPTYGFLLIFYYPNYYSEFAGPRAKLMITGVTFVFTFCLPALNALLLLRAGRIKTLEMETQRERIIPFTASAVYYLALYYLFLNVHHLPMLFRLLIFGAAISILITLAINFFWKISAHTVAIGGIIGAIFSMCVVLQMDLFALLIGSILVGGLVGFARLRLEAHTPAQVYAGYLTGFLVMLTIFVFHP